MINIKLTDNKMLERVWKGSRWITYIDLNRKINGKYILTAQQIMRHIKILSKRAKRIKLYHVNTLYL
jgi:hypothetical protein